MKHVLLRKDSQKFPEYKRGKAAEISLGGCFYDYLRSANGKVAGVRYWLIEPANFAYHPVYSQFQGDDRFVFDYAGDFVDIVFDECDIESLQKGQLTVDVVQEFGGESVLKFGEQFAIVFSLLE